MSTMQEKELHNILNVEVYEFLEDFLLTFKRYESKKHFFNLPFVFFDEGEFVCTRFRS